MPEFFEALKLKQVDAIIFERFVNQIHQTVFIIVGDDYVNMGAI
ncbi:MAG: hypothetical protein ABJL55_16480 [Roseibium sp.]